MSEPAIAPTRKVRRRTPTWLWLLLIVVALALLVVIPFAAWLFEQNLPPFTVFIGDSKVLQVHLGALTDGQRFAAVAGLFAAIVAAIVAVLSPLLLLIALARWIWRASATRAPRSGAVVSD